MRRAKVYYGDELAGLLTDTGDGEYVFQYDEAYVLAHPDQHLSFSLPVSSVPYRERRLFPFFEALLPEGWLLDMAITRWGVKRNDRMGLLLACCRDCIGAVSVIAETEGDET